MLAASLLLAGRGGLEAGITGSSATRWAWPAACGSWACATTCPALMNAADAYVLSSAWEGMPQVLQEASATGLPVVATDVGGNREVVLDGRSGLLVPPKDSGALAAAMRRMMAMGRRASAGMGRAGREHVQSLLRHRAASWTRGKGFTTSWPAGESRPAAPGAVTATVGSLTSVG